MSLEDTENIKNKLIDILEEELSALKLNEVNKNNENDNDICNRQNEGEENADSESFSSSSDTTAESLKEADNNTENERDCKISGALNSLTISEEIQHPNKYQNLVGELNHQKNEVYRGNKKSVETSESNISDKVCIIKEEEFISPPDSLAEKIRQRAEFYFEDYNLFKNSFLLNHIQRNKKGYVTLKLVSSLRKIKSLTRNLRVVAFSLKNSKILELNEEENRVRRIEPIPKPEDTSFGKTLMVFNLPTQKFSEDSLKEMFNKFGTVISAGIYEIESPTSNAYHERCFYFHRKIASKVYGIVEFQKYDEVVKALKDEDGHLPKENEVKAVPLLPQIFKKERRHLKFLRPYNSKPWRRYERYRPVNDFYSEATSSGEMRNEKISTRGGYFYNRGYSRRPYRGRKPFMSSNTKSFADDYYPREWNQPFRGMPKKWSENRQLRANNSLNIDRLYPDTERKKAGHGYAQNVVKA